MLTIDRKQAFADNLTRIIASICIFDDNELSEIIEYFKFQLLTCCKDDVEILESIIRWIESVKDKPINQ